MRAKEEDPRAIQLDIIALWDMGEFDKAHDLAEEYGYEITENGELEEISDEQVCE